MTFYKLQIYTGSLKMDFLYFLKISGQVFFQILAKEFSSTSSKFFNPKINEIADLKELE